MTGRGEYSMTKKRLWLLARCWLAVIAVGLLGSTVYMVYDLSTSMAAAKIRHAARLDPTKAEAGRTASANRAGELGVTPKNLVVKTGIYVDRVYDFAVANNSWSLDFYIWFNWKGDTIYPDKSFQMVEGVINEKKCEAQLDQGDEHYVLCRVSATITKHFNVSRFPRDDHMLTVRIEDTVFQNFDLNYIADIEGSDLSSRAKFMGYKPYYKKLLVKEHSYKTRRGDPRLPEGYKATYTQLIYGIGIKRDGWGLYFKMFLGIFSSLAVALIAFFVRPDDLEPRFGVGVGAFFAGVASAYLTTGEVPQTSAFGLADFVNGSSLILILLTVLTSAMSLGIHRVHGCETMARRFDLYALAVFLIGVIILNVSVAITASF